MNINEQFPRDYLNARDVDDWQRPALLSIRAVTLDTIGNGANAQRKPVLAFEEIIGRLPLNVINRNFMVGAFGPETDHWIGQQVVLYAVDDVFQGKPTRAMRLRLPKSQRATSGVPNPPNGRGHNGQFTPRAVPSTTPPRVPLPDDQDDIPF